MKLNEIKALKEQKNDLIEKQSSLFVGITETRAMEEVKNGETFSFCNTVGKATSSKGYEEADVFDHNGNKTKGLRRWKLPSK